jgi:hypothetical protein
VLHRHDDLGLVGVGDEVHGTANSYVKGMSLYEVNRRKTKEGTFKHLARDHEIGDIAGLRNLHGLNEGQILIRCQIAALTPRIATSM